MNLLLLLLTLLLALAVLCDSVLKRQFFLDHLTTNLHVAPPKLHTVLKLIIRTVPSLQYTNHAATAFSTQETRTAVLRLVLAVCYVIPTTCFEGFTPHQEQWWDV